MEIEEKVIKHLAKDARKTVPVVDEYGWEYI